MRTTCPEKILKIIADIDTQGNASLTRLTVLKKWFEHPGRLSVFALWVAFSSDFDPFLFVFLAPAVLLGIASRD